MFTNLFEFLLQGTLVFFMQSGFAMLCAGSVRQKNVKNILLKNLLDACGGALGFFFVGYGVAYGGAQEGTTFLGNGNFALRGFNVDDGDDWAFFFFQFAFAATAATIVAGTVAERCKMSAYLLYSVFLTGAFLNHLLSDRVVLTQSLYTRFCIPCCCSQHLG